MIRVGDLISPLINLMQEVLLGYDMLQMDETTLQVLKEKGRAATSKSYMWVASTAGSKFAPSLPHALKRTCFR